MKITEQRIKIRDLVKGYEDDEENGVYAYYGKLNVRPPYQREFVYKEKQRDAVITTINKGFPLNTMYWAVNEDGTYEIIDGQQRTVSICQFANGDFAYDFKYFHNLQEDEKNKFLDYELVIYLCEGTDSEKLDWFRVINIAGERLYEQELRNAVYHGEWVTSAKKFFSKTNCPAYVIGEKYLNGSCIRQDYLETALKWYTDGETSIEEYMGKHQHDPNANALIAYFKAVIEWVKDTFPNYRKQMKGINWGKIHKKYKDSVLDVDDLERRISELLKDSEIEHKAGIWEYVLDGDERHLKLRTFDEKTKAEVYEKQHGKCAMCKKKFDIEFMHADHKLPWSKGGLTVSENCQMLCVECNTRKGNNI